jgi:hypothetical protein
VEPALPPALGAGGPPFASVFFSGLFSGTFLLLIFASLDCFICCSDGASYPARRRIHILRRSCCGCCGKKAAVRA